MTEKTADIFRDPKGFTLIEIIAVLLILGAIGAVGTMTLTNMIESYQLARNNSHLTQKAQVALTRIANELNYATDVQITGNTIRYDAEYPDGTSSLHNRIGVQGGQTVLRLSINNNPLVQGYILANNVTDFVSSRPNDNLIDIELHMQGANGVDHTFTTSVSIR